MYVPNLVVAALTAAASACSGVAALVHFGPFRSAMERACIPESWLVFPIGTLQTAGALGLLAGLLGVPYLGTAAAVGLVLFFVCVVYTHILARDYTAQFALALGFLAMATATLTLDVTA